MNAIKNNFLITGDKFMSEIHLRQPGFMYSVFNPFIKKKERIKNFTETKDSRYIYQNELDGACSEHGMAYGDFKDLNRRTAADKVLSENAFNIAQNPKYDRFQGGLASMAYKFLDKKPFGETVKKRNYN